jgi:putative redox protein
MQITVKTLDGYRMVAETAENSVPLDAERGDGGEGTGPSPKEVFLVSLASCSAITMSMYARRKGWPLEGSEVTAVLEPAPAPGQPAKVVQTITLRGNLDEEQRNRLREIAGKCPVHRLVTGPTTMEERLA